MLYASAYLYVSMSLGYTLLWAWLQLLPAVGTLLLPLRSFPAPLSAYLQPLSQLHVYSRTPQRGVYDSAYPCPCYCMYLPWVWLQCGCAYLMSACLNQGMLFFAAGAACARLLPFPLLPDGFPSTVKPSCSKCLELKHYASIALSSIIRKY